VSAERSSLFFVPKIKKIVQNKVNKKISELAESVLANTDFFLVEVEIKGNKEPVVWVYIDADDRGVNMDECAEVSRELSFLMDAHDIFPGGYRINVSSPGVTRPLSDKRQFPKNQGRKAKVKYKVDGEYLKIVGTLQEVDENDIAIEQEDGSVLKLDYEQLVETKIIPTI
jgi:ribosome maturation factor RimP